MAPSTHSPAEGVVSLDQWVAFGVHEVTLPTGARVEIRLPDMGLLLAAGRVPDRLREGALKRFRDAVGDDPEAEALATAEESAEAKEAKDDPFDEAMLKELRDLNFWLVEQMLVSPKVTVADMEAGRLPNEDLEMLVDIALRERGEDALGVTIGVRPLEDFDRFPDERGGAAVGAAHEALGVESLPGPRLGEV